MTRVIAISGSLRDGSTNSLLLRAAAEEAPADVVVRRWDGLASIPAFDEDLESPAPPAVVELRRVLAQSDAVLIATPEYNGSVPGALKNALDWASRPGGRSALTGKPAAVVGASSSPFGALWAQAELRKVLSIAGAHVLETGVSLGKAAGSFDERGRLVDEAARAELGRLVGELQGAVPGQVLAGAA